MSDLQVIDASPEERAEIGGFKDALREAQPAAAAIRCGIMVAPDGTQFPMPEPLFRVLMEAATALVAGYQVMVAPVQHQMTTQEAADLLNISRPYLVGLLDSGKIPFEKVGRHRRVTFGEVMAYKKRRMSERRRALENLIHESEEAGLYDRREKAD